MKKIILTFFGLSSLLAVGQNVPIDFETGGNGANWTWATFENDDNPPLEIVDNPDKTGANTSDKVAKYTTRATGNPWAGCESMHGSDIGTFTLTPATSTITIMVYKTVISDVGIKLVEAGNGSLGEIKVANTKVNEWEKLTFDFSSREGIEYDQIVIFPDFLARTSDNVIYFDNIAFGGGVALDEPQTGAPDPTESQENVISLFSGVYADVPVTTWRTDWSNGVLADVDIDGNATKKYSALDFVGIETVGNDLIDASQMSHISLHFWSPNSTKFKIKVVDFGADEAFQGGDDTEHELMFDNPNQKSWVKYDIPLSDFTNLTNTDNIAQIILASEPSGSSVIYIDNLYFRSETVGVEELNSTAMRVYPNPAQDVVHVVCQPEAGSELLMTSLTGTVIGQYEISAQGETTINTSDLVSGMYLLKLQMGTGTSVQKIVIRK